MPKAFRGVTLVELLVAIILIFVVILGLSSIEIFSRTHLIGSSRRSLLQNELSHSLEHMSKNIVQASGNQLSATNQPIQLITNGFSVQIDPNQTPQDLADDLIYSYCLGCVGSAATKPNTLSVACVPASTGHASPAACPTGADTVLSTHINPGVVTSTIMPENNPAKGFYINITENGTTVEVGLVAKYTPSASSADISTNNPQIQMKNRLQARNVSTR
jgi:Tfp pilus assembly protein PilW